MGENMKTTMVLRVLLCALSAQAIIGCGGGSGRTTDGGNLGANRQLGPGTRLEFFCQ